MAGAPFALGDVSNRDAAHGAPPAVVGAVSGLVMGVPAMVMRVPAMVMSVPSRRAAVCRHSYADLTPPPPTKLIDAEYLLIGLDGSYSYQLRILDTGYRLSILRALVEE